MAFAMIANAAMCAPMALGGEAVSARRNGASSFAGENFVAATFWVVGLGLRAPVVAYTAYARRSPLPLLGTLLSRAGVAGVQVASKVAVPARMGAAKRGGAVTSARLLPAELPAGVTVEKMGKVRWRWLKTCYYTTVPGARGGVRRRARYSF
jgi:hypothetical protein